LTAAPRDEELEQLPLLRRRVVDLEAENIELREQLEQVGRSRAELPFAGLVDSVGLAVALGEATMPAHAISSVSMSAQAFLVPNGDGVGVRFQPPELADRAVGQSTATFELAKVPGEGPAIPSLYAVLHEKRRLYSGAPFASGKDGKQLALELSRTLGAADSWTVEFLARQAEAIATLERRFTGTARSGLAADARAAADEVLALADRLRRRRPVAGDIYALAAALRASTSATTALAAQTAARTRSSRSKPTP
jgi:hypothetical protein